MHDQHLWVLRLSSLPIRAERLRDLERVFGTTPNIVSKEVRNFLAHHDVLHVHEFAAIVVDVATSKELEQIMEIVGVLPVLRPIRREIKTSRREKMLKFETYGLLKSDGELQLLPEGFFLDK